MSLILAIEPDRHQASLLSGLASGPDDVELVVGATTYAAFETIGNRVPDLVLASPLLSAKDTAALAARLRQLDAAGIHVETLAIPPFAASGHSHGGKGGEDDDGCDQDAFRAQVTEYLEWAAGGRAELGAAQADLDALWADEPLPGPVVRDQAPPNRLTAVSRHESSDNQWEEISLEAMDAPSGDALDLLPEIHTGAVPSDSLVRELATVPTPGAGAVIRAPAAAGSQAGWQAVLSAIRRDIELARGPDSPPAPIRPSLDFSMATLVFPPRPPITVSAIVRKLPVPCPMAAPPLSAEPVVADPLPVIVPEMADAGSVDAESVGADVLTPENEPTPMPPPARHGDRRQPAPAARPFNDWGLFDPHAVGFGGLLARLKALAGRNGALSRP